MKRLIKKYQNAPGPIDKPGRWLRVKIANSDKTKSGRYGYIWVDDNNRPWEYDEKNGTFKVYLDTPNSKNYYWTNKYEGIDYNHNTPAHDYSSKHEKPKNREQIRENQQIDATNQYADTFTNTPDDILREYQLQNLQGSAHRTWYDSTGKPHFEFGEQGMSGADPLGKFYVEGVALGKPLQLAGRGLLYGAGRWGSGAVQNWSRAKLISGEIDKQVANGLKYPLGQQVETTLMYTPTREAYVPTSLKFYERGPARISEAERTGVPKGVRNQPEVSQRDYPVGTAQQYVRRGAIAKMDDNARYSNEMWKMGDFERVGTGETIKVPDRYRPGGYEVREKRRRRYYFSEQDPYSRNRLIGNRKTLDKYNDREGDILGVELPQEFIDYLEQIKDIPIHPSFTNLRSRDVIYPYQRSTLFNGTVIKEFPASEIQSKYVRDFRQYLGHLGYNTSNVSDEQLLRLITDQYKSLTNSMTGKTKGQVFWHEGPEYHSTFDFLHTGENTGNMGALGPGNYFSSGASAYGEVSQPYLITGIKQTPIGSKSMVEKGLIPEYHSPQVGNLRSYIEYLHSPEEVRLKYPEELRSIYEEAIVDAKHIAEKTPTEEDILWIDPALIQGGPYVPPRLSLTGVKPMEFMLRRNTGIKSLFPHPETFVRGSDGKVNILRNWNDTRVNYKKGGKLNNK